MKIGRGWTALVVGLLCAASGAWAEDMPKLRAAMLGVGTVNWEMTTIKSNGFDEKNGFELDVQDYADNAATKIAFEGGDADVMVSDWIWVARMRADGHDYVFLPYSKAVGGLVVKNDSGIEKLTDLDGKKIGIAGGPVDKSWLILRAYAQKKYDFDLAGRTEQVYGAPPLIFKAGLDGETAGAINFWHFLAKMKAAGMHDLVTVGEAAEALGLDPETPLLGYVFKGDFVAAHPDVVKGFAKASRAAKDLLATDDAAWDALRPRMRAKTDAAFVALREGFREGIPGAKPVDEAAAGRFLELMADLGGEKLVGKAKTLPEGVFLSVE